jgi:hypothetical protein
MVKRSKDWPLTSFLLALTVCTLLFIPDWIIFVQSRYSDAVSSVIGIVLPLTGLAAFCWSYKQSATAKSKRYSLLNTLGIIVIVCWLLFSILAIVMGIVFSSALDQLLPK